MTPPSISRGATASSQKGIGTIGGVKSRRSLLLALTLVLALVAAACGGSSDDDTTASAGSGDGEPAADAEGGDEAAIALVAPTASGGQIDFNDLQGSPTMLWFWAPW